MKTFLLLIALSFSCLGQGIKFSLQPLTNTFRGGDLFLIGSAVVGGDGYSIRACYLSNFLSQLVTSSNYVTLTQLNSSNFISSSSTFITSTIPFLSSLQLTNIAHGLGTNPNYLQGFVVCTNNDSSNGWTAGTRFRFDALIDSGSTPSGLPFFSLSADSTNIKLVAGVKPMMRGTNDRTFLFFNSNNWTMTIIAKPTL